MHLLHIAEAIALDGDPLSGASEAEAELIKTRVAERAKHTVQRLLGSLLM